MKSCSPIEYCDFHWFASEREREREMINTFLDRFPFFYFVVQNELAAIVTLDSEPNSIALELIHSSSSSSSSNLSNNINNSSGSSSSTSSTSSIVRSGIEKRKTKFASHVCILKFGVYLVSSGSLISRSGFLFDLIQVFCSINFNFLVSSGALMTGKKNLYCFYFVEIN